MFTIKKAKAHKKISEQRTNLKKKKNKPRKKRKNRIMK